MLVHECLSFTIADARPALSLQSLPVFSPAWPGSLSPPARATQASVFRARAAHLAEQLSERAARAMEANRRIVGGQAQLDRGLLERDLLEIHATQNDLILGLERPQHAAHAGADRPFQVGIVGSFGAGVPLEGLQASRLRLPSPVVVNQGVSEDPVEPRLRALLLAGRGALGHDLQERGLEDLLRGIAASDPPGQERQETTPAGVQDLGDFALARPF